MKKSKLKPSPHENDKVFVVLTEYFTFDYYISNLTEFCPKKNFVILGNFTCSQIDERIKKYTNVMGEYSFSGFYGEYIGKTLINGKEQVFKFNHVPKQLETQNIYIELDPE